MVKRRIPENDLREKLCRLKSNIDQMTKEQKEQYKLSLKKLWRDILKDAQATQLQYLYRPYRWGEKFEEHREEIISFYQDASKQLYEKLRALDVDGYFKLLDEIQGQLNVKCVFDTCGSMRTYELCSEWHYDHLEMQEEAAREGKVAMEVAA